MVPVDSEHRPVRCQTRGVRRTVAGAKRHLRDRRGHVHGSRPKPDNRDEQERRVQHGATGVFGREQLRERADQGWTTVGRDDFLLPLRRLADAEPDEADEERRQTADGKHRAPAVARTEPVVEQRREEESEVIPRVHVAGAFNAPILRPLFGEERPTHRPFTADADAGQQPKQRQLPNLLRERAGEGEDRVAQDGQHQRGNAAEAVGYRSPQHRQTPTHKKEREEDATVVADVAGRGRDAGFWQQFVERGHEDEGVDERVHPVQRPAAPGGPEGADLIAGKPGHLSRRTCRREAGGPSRSTARRAGSG